MEYGCIGEKLSHSFSKDIHSRLASYEYELLELSREELDEFFKKRNFKAINVTIPYKKDVIGYLDVVQDEAEKIGAVNTIVNKNGRLYGYNTDYYGMKALIERAGVSLNGKSVAVTGSGGTSNTAFCVAADMGAKSIVRVSRNPRDSFISYDELYENYSDTEVLINTTPCGMFPNIGNSAVDIKRLPRLMFVADAVYNPLRSKLVSDALSAGINACGGLYMLVSQAAFAIEFFTGNACDGKAVEKVYRDLFCEKQNIVLIGMPGSGKTTVGKALSKLFGRCFTDTDELITATEKRTIRDIFEKDGEGYFRELEKKCVHEVSKQNSAVIATGGGAVLNKENIDFLKENGRIYFLDRPLSQIIYGNDRPLVSNKTDLERIYGERYEKYIKSADTVIDASESVDNIIKQIKDEFYGYSCY